MINYDDFKKLEMKVARIKSAEKVEGSDKLLRLIIDMAGEERQLVAGIAKSYAPEALRGTEIIIIANLEPKKLMGLESRGMLLAARDENGLPVLLRPEKDVATGTDIN